MDIKGIVMIDMNLKRNLIRARGYRLTAEEMRVNRIIGVYNSVGMNLGIEYVERFARDQYYEEKGEVVIIERNVEMVSGVYMDVVSVIVFKNLISMQVFVLRHGDTYLRDKQYLRFFPTLMN